MPLVLMVRQVSSRARFAAVFWTVFLASNSQPLVLAQATNEYEWKANFLAKSAAFLDWPGDSPGHAANAFRWCVFGTFPFGTSLAELTRDLVIDGKKSEVKWVHKETELVSCQIIFISRSEEKRYARLLDAARAGRGLTVGETTDFLDAGGMVTLLTDGKTPAFEVNLEAVEAARMKLSSRLLVLARRVVQHSTAAKG